MPVGYRIALVFHFAALLAAISASSIVHFAEGQLHSARRAPEAKRWLALLLRTTVVFPIVLVTLLASGWYMVSTTWSWSAGWVDTGLLTLVLLLVNGMLLGRGGAALMAALNKAGDAEIDRSPELARLRSFGGAAWVNTAMAIAVVVVMTFKLGIAGSLTILAAGILVGIAVGAGPARSPALGAASENEAA